MRTGDDANGIEKKFDAQKVQKDVAAQVQITATFGQQAAKAIGDYADAKYRELKDSDPTKAAKWAEGGSYRVAAHTVLGGLTGGAAGAAGALTSQATIDVVAKQIAQLDVPDAVRSALITGAGAAIGAATGGTAGAATAFNATANNYLQHSTKWRSSQWGAFKEELARCKVTPDCSTDAVYARWTAISSDQQRDAIASMDGLFGLDPSEAAKAGAHAGAAAASMNVNPADICSPGDARCYSFVQQQTNQAATVFRYGLTTALATDLVDLGAGRGANPRKTYGETSTPGATNGKGTPDSMLAEADFAGRIPTRGDLENHLVNPTVSGRQISGGHNMNNFQNTLDGAGGTVISKKEVSPGIYEIEYFLPKGAGKEPQIKTVYDPSVYSDTQIIAMANEAAARAQINFQTTGIKDQHVLVNGVKFFTPIKINAKTGKLMGIQTAYPVGTSNR
ncbi:CdiA family toxin C-terminal domain-containing protein [Xylophilus sp. GOD-11R]|uniref:CdiA family toxin C-terminal domain-containing protein n=1 Tax=Xylophilus sp. GOD-11R TaxID=3089814 RepID=UPI00298BD9C1|nr:CdiA family toxin C-terminal domain-containing protein [Xylophilus sp. GOD-11R]WPB59205.1 CdiA family toxin C-terminal domain-containing protein [Xylophilus sp. GOD-11R]